MAAGYNYDILAMPNYQLSFQYDGLIDRELEEIEDEEGNLHGVPEEPEKEALWMVSDQIQKVLSIDTNTAPPKSFTGIKGRLMNTGTGLLEKVKAEKKRKMLASLQKAAMK